ncbi:aminotransferase class IV family protein [Pelagibius marinus]|uniref:aminotransferase class IV family protein n=1 Tax=Pelagibius marinus TaxID=2762760 RepID=UPI001872D618|nr:aminotransferase class IV family protein [Pelagibius marinus]
MESPLYELAPAGLKVIETLRWEPGEGFCRLARHLARAGRTCARLRFAFDRAACEAALSGAVQAAPAPALRCRLTLDRQGQVEVTAAPLGEAPAQWHGTVSPERLAAEDPWLAVKTTQRRLYDDTRAALPSGIDEVIFLNQEGEVCEGTITNVFARLEGKLVTPPLACGLLPGVLREELLETGAAEERRLRLDELRAAEAVFLGNSLRGLIPAELVPA